MKLFRCVIWSLNIIEFPIFILNAYPFCLDYCISFNNEPLHIVASSLSNLFQIIESHRTFVSVWTLPYLHIIRTPQLNTIPRPIFVVTIWNELNAHFCLCIRHNYTLYVIVEQHDPFERIQF